MDPELFISIVDLGLIYNIYVDDSNVTIEMTLTTLGCPLFSIMEESILRHARKASHGRKTAIKLVFDPAWSLEMVSPNAKAELGIL